jgi:hypothetical protein
MTTPQSLSNEFQFISLSTRPNPTPLPPMQNSPVAINLNAGSGASSGSTVGPPQVVPRRSPPRVTRYGSNNTESGTHRSISPISLAAEGGSAARSEPFKGVSQHQYSSTPIISQTSNPNGSRSARADSPPRITIPGKRLEDERKSPLPSIVSGSNMSTNVVANSIPIPSLNSLSYVTSNGVNPPVRRVPTPSKIMTPPKIAIYGPAMSLHDTDTREYTLSESPESPTFVPQHLIDGITQPAPRLRGLDKWTAFSKLYPNNTIAFTIRVNDQGALPKSYVDNEDTGSGNWYSSDESNSYGARVLIQPNDPDVFVQEISKRNKSGNGVAIYATYNRHVNILWITADLEIYRFEPEVPGGNYEQRAIDGGLSGMFASCLPTYSYIPHRLEKWQCLYNPDKVDGLQCEDYALLYILRRIKGFNHEDAITDMVIKSSELTDEDILLTQNLNQLMLQARFTL